MSDESKCSTPITKPFLWNASLSEFMFGLGFMCFILIAGGLILQKYIDGDYSNYATVTKVSIEISQYPAINLNPK